jgi:hypothetical protein
MVTRSRERWNFCRHGFSGGGGGAHPPQNKKIRKSVSEFLSRPTLAWRENVSVWTERQTDKIGNDILETLGNVTVCKVYCNSSTNSVSYLACTESHCDE